MMRELPILFSGPMVRAILDGRKTQTRRLAGLEKVNVESDAYTIVPSLPDFCFLHTNGSHAIARPRYQVGDVLYVREGFRCTGGGDWKGVIYRADGGDSVQSFVGVNDGHATTLPKSLWPEWDRLVYKTDTSTNWRPSIHMPKWAARIWLEVTKVRVERLPAISIEDILSEGLVSYQREHDATVDLTEQWRKLWDSLNAKRGYSWESNPWVFVYDFKVLSTKGKPE